MSVIEEYLESLPEAPGRYNRKRALRQAAIVVQLLRPDTTDEDALRIGRSASNLILSELIWLDVLEGKE